VVRKTRGVENKMLTYKLIKESEKEAIYEYYPEGSLDAGLISYNKISKEKKVVRQSLDDRHKRYAMKMFQKIRESENEGELPQRGMIVWY
jgi:CRISPR/Cas system-associated exonuclease Cas4 (RecB family)